MGAYVAYRMFNKMLLDRRELMMRDCEELVAALPSTECGWQSLLSAGERLLDYGSAHEELPREKVTSTAARCALAGHMLCLLTVVRNQLDQISNRQLIAKLGIVVDNLKSQKANIEDKIKKLETLGEKLSELLFIRGGEYDGVIADFDRLVVSITADLSRCSTEIDNTKSVVDAIHNKINAEVNDQAKKGPLAGLGMFLAGGPILLGYSLVKSNQQKAEYMKDLEGLAEIRGELDSLEHRMDDFSIRVREHVGFLCTNGINVCSESLHKF